MPDTGSVVMLLAAGIGLVVAVVIGWLLSVMFITWLHGGKEWARKNYSEEDIKRIRELGL